MKTAQDLAISYNITNALQYEFPNLSLDFSNVLVSNGKLLITENPAIELNSDFLKFT